MNGRSSTIFPSWMRDALPRKTRRATKTTELPLKKFGKGDRRAILKTRSDDLHPDRQTRGRTVDRRRGCWEAAGGGRVRPQKTRVVKRYPLPSISMCRASIGSEWSCGKAGTDAGGLSTISRQTKGAVGGRRCLREALRAVLDSVVSFPGTWESLVFQCEDEQAMSGDFRASETASHASASSYNAVNFLGGSGEVEPTMHLFELELLKRMGNEVSST